MAKKTICILMCLAVFILPVCTSTVVYAENSEDADGLSKCKNVLVFEPVIVFEDAYTEKNLNYIDTETKNLIDQFNASSTYNVLSATGHEVTEGSNVSGGTDVNSAESYARLRADIENLCKKWKDKSGYLKDLTSLKAGTNADAILLQFVKVKVGNPGGWDFMFTGTVIPDSTTTSIKAAILDINTGRCLWEGSAIERTKPTLASVKTLYKTLFSSFPGYNSKEKKHDN